VKVLFYAGCLINQFYPEIGHASVRVLREHNVEVTVAEEKCCGISAFASGDMKAARKTARWNVEAFARQPVDAIVTSCPTCAMVFKEYPWLFRGQKGAFYETVCSVTDKIHDLSEFVVDHLKFSPPKGRLTKKVTYHDPCHLNYELGITEEPRTLIKAVKGVEFVEMERPDLCCGFGGFFSLIDHHDLASTINDRLIEQIRATGAELVLDACPPCILQLREGFYRQGITDIQVQHVAELLEEAYGGKDR
jgi:glycolate oxidase iron-sulfur subunit